MGGLIFRFDDDRQTIRLWQTKHGSVAETPNVFWFVSALAIVVFGCLQLGWNLIALIFLIAIAASCYAMVYRHSWQEYQDEQCFDFESEGTTTPSEFDRETEDPTQQSH